MVRCNHNNSLAWNDPARFETAVLDTAGLYKDEIFVRVRVRVDTDVRNGGDVGQKILRFFFADATRYHDLFSVAGHQQNEFNNAGNANYSGPEFPTYWGGASGDHTNAHNSGWHTVAYYIKQSTGSVKVWHDGVLIRDDTGFNFEGLKWSPFYLCSNGDDGNDANNHIYFDDFEVYSDLGAGGTGSMSAATIRQLP
jgi:hypothetical protein